MWMIVKLYNLVVNKIRSLKIIVSQRGKKIAVFIKKALLCIREKVKYNNQSITKNEVLFCLI